MSSVKQKLVNMVKTTITNTTPQDIAHVNSVDREATLKMIQAKKTWLLDYQQQREKKREYVKLKVVA